MTRQWQILRIETSSLICAGLIALCPSVGFGEAPSQACPSRELTDEFTAGIQPIEFRYADRYESVTFVTDQGLPRVPERGEVEALAKSVEGARIGVLLHGASLREFGSIVIRLEADRFSDEQLREILGQSAVAGRDRTRGTGNPIYDAGDVDYVLVNQSIVQFSKSASETDIVNLLSQYCAQTVRRRQRAGSWRHIVKFDGEVARHALAMTNRLAQESIVEFAQPDVIVIGQADVRSGATAAAAGATCPAAPSVVGVDPYFPSQWHLDHQPSMPGNPTADINAPDAWALAQGDGVILAVLDDAIETSHEDLVGRIHSQWNAFDGSNDLGMTDQDKHGTPVAGIAGALTGNQMGVKATAPQVMVMAVRVMEHVVGTGSVWEEFHPYSVVVDGLELAAANGASVISMSLSLGSYRLASCDDAQPVPTCQSDLVSAVSALGGTAVLVFPTGNYSSPVVFPASLAGTMSNVIAVGATDEFDNIKKIDPNVGGDWGSSFGPEVTVVAPGTKVLTTDRTEAKGFCGGNYVEFLGTSASTPIVAGIAALMQSQYAAETGTPLQPAALKSRLQATAVDLGTVGFDHYYGHGRADACKALMQNTCPKSRKWQFLIAALAVLAAMFAWWWKYSRKV